MIHAFFLSPKSKNQYFLLVLLIFLHPLFDIIYKLDLSYIMLVLSLELLLQIFEIIESSFHFSDLWFGRVELVIYLIGFIIAARSFDAGQLIGFISLYAILLSVWPKRLII